MEYPDIKGQNTSISYFTPKCGGDSSEHTPAFLENQFGTVPYLLWDFKILVFSILGFISPNTIQSHIIFLASTDYVIKCNLPSGHFFI